MWAEKAGFGFEPPSDVPTVTENRGERRSHGSCISLSKCLGRNGARGEIRTPGLLVRSQTLYPTELRAHASLKDYQTGLKTPSSQVVGRWPVEDVKTSGLREPLRPEPDSETPCFGRSPNSVP